MTGFIITMAFIAWGAYKAHTWYHKGYQAGYTAGAQELLDTMGELGYEWQPVSND